MPAVGQTYAAPKRTVLEPSPHPLRSAAERARGAGARCPRGGRGARWGGTGVLCRAPAQWRSGLAPLRRGAGQWAPRAAPRVRREEGERGGGAGGAEVTWGGGRQLKRGGRRAAAPVGGGGGGGGGGGTERSGPFPVSAARLGPAGERRPTGGGMGRGRGGHMAAAEEERAAAARAGPAVTGARERPVSGTRLPPLSRPAEPRLSRRMKNGAGHGAAAGPQPPRAAAP